MNDQAYSPTFENLSVILQARTNSSRLPRKIFAKIGSLCVLEIIVSRLNKSKYINDIILATTDDISDDSLSNFARSLGLRVIRGSKEDLLDRFELAANIAQNDLLCRVTGDCPLIDSSLIDSGFELFQCETPDYLSNVNPPTYPDGLDFELLTKSAFYRSLPLAKNSQFYFHPTEFIRNSDLFRQVNMSASNDNSEFRLTIDEPEDLCVIRQLSDLAGPLSEISYHDILKLIRDDHPIFRHNLMHVRNEGANTSQGQKLWKRAKQLIPGGNMLLSKQPDRYLPDHWPAYFSKAKGCNVWDLDHNKFTDMSIMGIGTNILGYGRAEVDDAVLNSVKNGNMSTLNCPEEVYLAQRLVDIHPWSDMVKFARSGGEANAIAIRIARAATGRDKVAICGYHGWHDWYLSTNLSSPTGLKGHLMRGLEISGVPSVLKGTSIPFEYNKIEQLEAIFSDNKLAAVKMEVERSFPPEPGFLESVRSLCDKNNTILIFDECTSGFRECFGGLHLKYGVTPDIAMFGKALGNGYAITAVIGKEAVMQAAQDTFISSTFWTERIGPSAALATLDIMESEQSWDYISQVGKDLKASWKSLAAKYQLDIDITGINPLPSFSFKSEKSRFYTTYISQELLKEGFLASDCCYVSTAHTQDIVNTYLSYLEKSFANIALCETGEVSIKSLLKSRPAISGFARLN
ncbi:N-acylneuraminate cytidylyltransferase/pyridoxal phosphate-dependent transferase domain-containing protein [Synechococcus sp. MIT S9220]|uniref:aminotransferase class III-fold pyridoxal phosphate-dependent enzyme n=1 Tax=unclassified Synechococcus TaxID=2626047 RepID=UPI00164A2BF9|nr:aminotransferase class III-fold pyridoxal phosphate-dependent enzyme [Synechococcus sp. MIT S9220]NOL48030.1 aminotransferase class III-fold pyridoxal phosphate-dependent enzyme [Synechococcus sp. MIT S9220]QNJ21534.1 N-acylneuraminate cytidylyltransferase/pyridoxal phosphate-dependent transferase domain-containing protein [Synechococcus sp. MIT S9220]